MANAIVNVVLHTNLDIVQTNCHEITEITMSWSSGQHDVFSIRDHSRSYSIDELILMQRYVIEVVICTSYVSVDSDSCDLNFIEVDAETEVS